MASGKDVAIIVGAVGTVAVAGYVVYSFFNAGPPGGSCDCTQAPGSPCCAAITPYQQEFQACLSQYTQLWSQIVQGGQAPTSAQQSELDQLKACMDQAAANIAATAGKFIPQNSIASLLDSVGEAVLVVAIGVGVAFGLKGLSSFISARRAGGQLKTSPGNPAGIAALMDDGIVQYAASNSLITQAASQEFAASVDTNASNDLYNLGSFYDSLVAQQVFDQSFATSQINLYTSTINADADTTITELPPPV